MIPVGHRMEKRSRLPWEVLLIISASVDFRHCFFETSLHRRNTSREKILMTNKMWKRDVFSNDLAVLAMLAILQCCNHG